MPAQLEPSRERSLLIAIHDVAPETLSDCIELVRWVEQVDPQAPLTLLVVPHFHGRTRVSESAECREWLRARAARGDEIVLHGERHLDESPPPRTVEGWIRRRVFTASEGEFAALDEREARQRISRGLDEFERCGFPVRGFVAPAWAMNHNTLAALKQFPFDYATDLQGFHFPSREMYVRVPVVGMSARSPMRRQLSKAWLALGPRLYAREPCIRVALHPVDARYEDIRDAWCRALATLLRTRRAVTKQQWVRQQIIASNRSSTAELRSDVS